MIKIYGFPTESGHLARVIIEYTYVCTNDVCSREAEANNETEVLMSFLARSRRKASKQTGMKIAAVLAAMSLSLVMIVGIAGAIMMNVITGWLQELPDYTAEGAFDVMEPTSVYSADNVLIARLYLQNREIIPLDDMSPWILKAIIAVEDERFYEHQGVDVLSVVRAAITGYGGASSITQQYIRATVLMDEATDQTVKRKVREAFLALELEKRYTKDEILSMYLNTVYFGNGAYGIEAAAKNIFDKRASELNITEAALLAGLPNQPSQLNPWEHPDGYDDLIARRNIVLDRMNVNGYINQDELSAALEVEPAFKSSPLPTDGIYSADYFVDMVKRQLFELFGNDAIFGGGMKVYTTLNSVQQYHAEQAVWQAISYEDDELQGALVAVDPRTGYVHALVGGTDFEKDKFNLATQAQRHPGSSFKTFTLLAAINEGVSPETPVNCKSPITLDNGGEPWKVENAEGGNAGVMSLRAATAWSYNTAYALLIDGIGADKVVDIAHAAGIKSPLMPWNSLTLGAQEVNVLEMSSAYATIANSGVYNEPTFVTSVKNRKGVEIWEHIPDPIQTITPEVAYACTQVLKTDVMNGTATAANLAGRPVAGKTGTSENYGNVYFVGYTMELSTAVWVGYPDDTRTITWRGGYAYGGVVCAPIFREFMMPALEGLPFEDFPVFDAPPYDSERWRGAFGGKVEEPEDDEDEEVEEVEPDPEPDPEPEPPPTPPIVM